MRATLSLASCVLLCWAVALPARAATVTLVLSAPISSGEYHSSEPGTISFLLPASSFVVSDGDSVRASLMFAGGEVLRILYNDLGPSVSARGALIVADQDTPAFQAEFGFAFAFLDADGSPLLCDSAARVIRGGGDLIGDVTMRQEADMEVGGFSMEFSEVENGGIGGLPVTFEGVRFRVHSAVFAGLDADEPDPTTPVPVPMAFLMAIPVLVWVVLSRRLPALDERDASYWP